MTGWLVGLLLVAIFGVLWWRQCERHRSELHIVSGWLRDVLRGEVPRGPHHSDSPELLAVAAEVTRVATHVEGIVRDQTAEAANLQTILASMTEGVMVVDGRHSIRLANPAVVQIFDLKSSPVGRSVLHAVRDVHVEEIVTSTLHGEQPSQIELTLAHVKPHRHLAISATPILDASGETAVLLICHDITRLKQLEDVRREFVANVSHELRTPLSIFQGYLETLIDYPDISRQDLVETLEILRKHSTRLNALVEDLLVLARLESRADILCVEPIDPRKLIDDMAADWKIQASRKSIEITASCSEDVPEFEADAFRIEQVLNNLIDNAIKYTNARGHVEVSAAPCDVGVEFRVKDTGSGIPPQDLGHVFERFYRADKARSREHGGTGLGLSIVKHIVQKHGGCVRAESVYGQGTTIILTFPVQSTFSGSTAQPGRESQPAVDRHEHHPEPHLIK